MPPVTLFIRIRARPGRRDAVHALWETHLKPRAEANAAQAVYFLCADDGDPDTLWLFEHYRDRDELTANARAPWFHDYLAAVAPLLDGEPEAVTATPLWSKGAGGGDAAERPSPERALALAYLERFCAGDVEGLVPLLAGELAFSGPYLACNTAADYLDALRADPPEPTDYELVSVTEGPGRAALFYRYLKPAGSLLVAQQFEIEGGRIAAIRTVFDRDGPA